MENHKLAVVIANYNGYTDTMKCLNSLEKSVFRDFFVVLVDDCSTEKKSLELPYHIEKAEYEKKLGLVFKKLNENRGFAGANNEGIRTALGKMSGSSGYVLLLNNDTVVPPDAIGKLVEYADFLKAKDGRPHIVAPLILSGEFQANTSNASDTEDANDTDDTNCKNTKNTKDTNCKSTETYVDISMYEKSKIYSAGGRINKTLRIPENIGAGMFNNDLYKENAVCDYVSFCCALIPAQLFETVGLISEDYFMYSEDVDYCLSAKKAGAECNYYSGAVIFHKDGGTGFARSERGILYGIRNECIIRHKYFTNGDAYNKKLFSRTRWEYIARKILFRKNRDNELYYLALKTYLKGSSGREPLFDKVNG